MGEELDVGTFFYDSHAEGAEVTDLVFCKERGAGSKDGPVEMEGCGEGLFERFDARERKS